MFSHRSLYFIFPYREVEDFARRLNSVWPERMQELFQGRKLVPISLNGNSSMSRYTSRFLSQVSFILIIDAPSLLGFIASIPPRPPVLEYFSIELSLIFIICSCEQVWTRDNEPMLDKLFLKMVSSSSGLEKMLMWELAAVKS